MNSLDDLECKLIDILLFGEWSDLNFIAANTISAAIIALKMPRPTYNSGIVMQNPELV